MKSATPPGRRAVDALLSDGQSLDSALHQLEAFAWRGFRLDQYLPPDLLRVVRELTLDPDWEWVLGNVLLLLGGSRTGVGRLVHPGQLVGQLRDVTADLEVVVNRVDLSGKAADQVRLEAVVAGSVEAARLALLMAVCAQRRCVMRRVQHGRVGTAIVRAPHRKHRVVARGTR